MKQVVGLVGPGNPTSAECELASGVGTLVAKANCVLLTGGMGGIMQLASKSAQAAGGLVLGMSPGGDPRFLNDYVDVGIFTDMNHGRNYLNVLTARAVIGIGVSSPGTLSEVAYALVLERPTLLLGVSGVGKTYLRDVARNKKRLWFGEDLTDVPPFFARTLGRSVEV